MKETYFRLKNMELMPRFGQGTWHMGEQEDSFDKEVDTLRFGINQGISLIDTAEMYGDGNAEIVVSEAIKGIDRKKLFIVDKILPINANKYNFYNSLTSSLKRLKTDYIDMYLLHWRYENNLEEVIKLMEEAKNKGLIKNWGVSNFDTDDMEELLSLKDGNNCSINQCLYNISSRGVEYNLIPLLKKNNIGFMAYCPLAQPYEKREFELIKNNKILNQIAKKYNVSIYAIMIAFTLRKNLFISIPKASNKEHIMDNIKGAELKVDEKDWDLLDNEFKAPSYKTPLDIR